MSDKTSSPDLFGVPEDSADPASGAVADILLPVPLGPFAYRLPEDVAPVRGLVVSAKLSGRSRIGAVWGPPSKKVPENKLKDAGLVTGGFVLPPTLCDFIDWMAKYTMAHPGMVLGMVLRALNTSPPQPHYGFVFTGQYPEKMTKSREKVLSVAEDFVPRAAAALAKEAGVTSSVVKGLAGAGSFRRVQLPDYAPMPKPDPDFAEPHLHPEQEVAAAALVADVKAESFHVSLLDGITGSGKTETYFAAVAEALRNDKQVVILLPEISLSVQFLDRFAARFGVRPAEWHSEMTPAAKRRIWQSVICGDTRVVVGARSALLLPYTELGLIVVDEEHDTAYKQEDGVIYNARDMAVVRGHIEKCPVILASATPSIESFVNAQQGRYTRLQLTRRHGAAGLPDVKLVDLTREHGDHGTYLSPTLRNALKETLANGEQAMLFLNRRGFAPLTLCESCGHKMVCKNCSAWLVEHRATGKLVCHHCGFEMPIPKVCPECGAEGTLIPCGPGVERVAEEFHSLFPDARMAMASSDTMDTPEAMNQILRDMADHKIDVVVGTQIVAKGHNFPLLTLVGVVDGDLGASDGDPRARERTFQLLHQVSGRAGRADRPGTVLIQTRNADDAVMKALEAGDRDAFYQQEIGFRRAAGVPPFGRLAAIILSGLKPELVKDGGQMLADAVPKAQGIKVWGPAPAFYALLRGLTRERLLVQAEKNVNMQAFLSAWLSKVKLPRQVRLTVDIDPMNFF